MSGDPCNRLDEWLSEDPEINSAVLSKGSTGDNYQVRLLQVCINRHGHHIRRDHDCSIDQKRPNGERVIADAESATLEGAIEGALMLAREFHEGL